MAKPDRRTETELKLVVSPSAEHRLAGLAVFRPPCASKPKTQRIVTTYFDTPNLDLARRGLSLRVRRAGKKHIQAVKADGNSGPAKARGEWEWPISGEKPNLALAAETPVGGALPPDVGKALRPVVVTDIVRTTRTLYLEDATIEAVLNSGSIEAGDVNQPVHELELELRDGTPGALYRLALELHAATPLAVEVESKAARGLRLKEGGAPRPEKAVAPEFDRDIRAVDWLREIVANALGHLLANRAAALAGDAEGIHQTRVGLRRLRSALKLFEPRLEPHATALFQRELKRLGRVIGEARDWDVFCVEMLPESFHEPDDAEWGELIRAAAEARRRLADATSARALRAASFTALVLGLAAWTETGRTQRRLLGDDRLKKRLAKVAPRLLDRLARKVEKRARKVNPEASPAVLHPLRKTLKKLRYGAEFVASLYPRKAVKRFLRPIKRLQETLGVINDSATATRLAVQLAGGGHLELGVPVGALAANRDEARRAAMRRLGKQWRELQRQKPFWK